MKKTPHLLKFFIRANIIILFSIFVAYTMVGFIYFYYHLHQPATGYFSWWWGHIKGFKIMEYKYYIIAFEIVLFVVGILYVRNELDHKTGHEDYK
jgi:hypothetical protein